MSVPASHFPRWRWVKRKQQIPFSLLALRNSLGDPLPASKPTLLQNVSAGILGGKECKETRGNGVGSWVLN